MTYEEAIELLCTEYYASHEIAVVPKEVVKLAIEALQKQEPMRHAGVNIVRCKDCKFYQRGKTWHCDKVSYFENGINDMFYCAFGEEK